METKFEIGSISLITCDWRFEDGVVALAQGEKACKS